MYSLAKIDFCVTQRLRTFISSLQKIFKTLMLFFDWMLDQACRTECVRYFVNIFVIHSSHCFTIMQLFFDIYLQDLIG